jgi:pimeloyl-ACP methyl ester carboxylesterase
VYEFEAAEARALLARATPRRIALAEVELALLDFGGPGAPALLHHANGFCKGCYALLAAALAPRVRVIAMDGRGHGDSSHPEAPGRYAWRLFAEDLAGVAERLIGQLGLARLPLAIGHSFGGTSLLGAAKRRPELFERIALVDPVTPASGAAARAPARAAHVGGMVERATKRRHEWPSRAEARAFFAERELFAGWHPTALDLYVLDGLRERPDGSVELKCPGTVEAAVFAGGEDVDVEAVARGNSVPALWLHAARGSFSRPRYEALAASMRDARVESLDAGHLAPMERPELVAEAILRFAAAGL